MTASKFRDTQFNLANSFQGVTAKVAICFPGDISESVLEGIERRTSVDVCK
jgi:hypothetical protein